MEMEKQINTAPVLPVPGTLLLPGTTIKLSNLSAMDVQRLEEGPFVALAIRNEGSEDLWKADNFYHVGVLCKVIQISSANGVMDVTARTLHRVHLESLQEGLRPLCTYTDLPEDEDLEAHFAGEVREYILKTVREISSSFKGGQFIAQAAEKSEDLNQLIVLLAQYMTLTDEERFALLACDSLKERCLLFLDLLLRQKEMISLNMEMNEKFSQEANKMYRRQALKRQLQAIQAQLDEEQDDDEKSGEADHYSSRIQEAHLPEKIEKALLEDANRLERATAGTPDAETLRNYLDFALSLPWKKETPAEISLPKAREILNSRHYGMDKVKERIIEHLAIMRLRKSSKGSALLLVGPPGTGKTSLGKSIAQALQREYVRLSLGGIRDESEIRGHRRTYIGAMSGRILQAMKSAGTSNPVMILDEMDKLMQGGFSGDPAAALLEVLDPEQNDTFTDHYLDLPFDLSDVFFIGTANSLDSIPAPLLDRMEIIQVSSYTQDEKFEIARRHLLPEVLEDHGMNTEMLSIDDAALHSVVEDYTMEAGCRGLKKRLAQIARSQSEKIAEGQSGIVIRPEMLEDILGAKIARHEKVQEANPAGVITGLAWTPVGGEVLFIETTDIPGNGQVILTGQLGDVMKESARISMSVLKSRLPLDMMNFSKRDIHIHVPAGATPKDGPSAGITLFTALASLVLNKPVDSHIAMTGELTLRGDVLPIGGLKEKLFGAQRAGITKVLIPWDNQSDLKEVPQEIKEKLTIVPVRTVEDVLKETLNLSLMPMENVVMTQPGFYSFQ